MKNIYVLLAGINAYRSPVSKLNGCIKDLDQIEKFLSDHYNKEYNLQVLRLADSDATHQKIIDGFRNHLCQAGPDDVAWFHFSGHGSEEYTADEFWPIEPTGYDQTLLCYDSGHDGVENMADKELAVLLHEVGSQYPDGSAKETPHIVVSLDCCHSGSGTRSIGADEEVRTRNTPSRGLKRPFSSYVDGYYSNQEGQVQVPLSTHIVLSACENIQLAGDLPSGGAFTSGLINALTEAEGQIDYVDLFQQTRSAVKKLIKDQTPQFATIGNLNPYTRFLDGEPFGNPEKFEITNKDGTWYVECGAIHGLPTHPQQPIELEIFTPSPDNKSVGEAVIKSVGALRSPIDLDANIDIKNLFKSIVSDAPDYRALLKHLPAPPEIVLLTGDPAGISLLKKHWDSSRSIIATEDDCGDYSIQVIASLNGYDVHDHNQNKIAFHTEMTDESSVGMVIKALEKIVKWRRFIALENNDRASKIADGLEFELEVLEVTQSGPKSTIFNTDEIKLYGNASNTMNRAFGINPKFKILDSNRTLYFYCFYIDEQYAIKSPEGERIYRPEERPNVDVYEQTMWSEIQGFGPEAHESYASAWIKILVTTDQLNYEKFLQEGLGASRATFNAWGATLSDDWTTFTTRITVAWENNKISDNQPLELPGGVATIKGSNNVTAKVSLGNSTTSTRSSDPSIQFDLMQQDNFKVVEFGGSRNPVQQNVIELRDIKIGDPALLKSEPLEIALDVDSEDGIILPVAFDGTNFRVIGDSDAHSRGTAVHIRDLSFSTPDAGDAGQVDSPFDDTPKDRSLFSALKLAFFKLALKKSDVNVLSRAILQADNGVILTTDNLSSDIAESKNTLLVLHGLAGDCKSIIDSLGNHAGEWLNGYDCILCYDYESLNTPLDETAVALKEALIEVGISDNEKGRLTIIGHSVGGLIARWLVEWTGAQNMVDRCILVGTPHLGSMYGRLEEYRAFAMGALDLAINFIPNIVPFSGYVLQFLKGVGELTGTLGQISPGSELIQRLQKSQDPGIPYTIIGADYTVPDTGKTGLSGMVDQLQMIGGNSDGSDLFAPTSSTTSKSFANDWSSDVIVRAPLMCHHFNYFTHISNDDLS